MFDDFTIQIQSDELASLYHWNDDDEDDSDFESDDDDADCFSD